jgi:hypothetical protein
MENIRRDYSDGSRNQNPVPRREGQLRKSLEKIRRQHMRGLGIVLDTPYHMLRIQQQERIDHSLGEINELRCKFINQIMELTCRIRQESHPYLQFIYEKEFNQGFYQEIAKEHDELLWKKDQRNQSDQHVLDEIEKKCNNLQQYLENQTRRLTQQLSLPQHDLDLLAQLLDQPDRYDDLVPQLQQPLDPLMSATLQSYEQAERKRIEKIGQLLGRDLSRVSPKRWIDFCKKVLDEHESEYGIGSGRIVGDILQGQTTHHVSSQERVSKLYKEEKTKILIKVDKLLEQLNNEREQ